MRHEALLDNNFVNFVASSLAKSRSEDDTTRYGTAWQGAILCCPDVAPGAKQAVSRHNLTDRFINSRKPAPSGQRQEYADAIVPGLTLRVTDRGHKSFALIARYPSNPKNPTRRALGDVGVIGLDEARQKARKWLELVGKGIDPKAEEARQRAALQRRQVTTFSAVAD